jgi:hypothetical protein
MNNFTAERSGKARLFKVAEGDLGRCYFNSKTKKLKWIKERSYKPPQF